MITSKGYGKKKGKDEKTSILRHMIPHLEPGEYALIEPIDVKVFHLNNEYWVSFYQGDQLFDKKFIFVPDSIQSKNLTYIPELECEGILHS
jgi:phage repressor protein C with HTH and peptisase S24 domain